MTLLIILITLIICLLVGLQFVTVRDYLPDYDEVNNKLTARKVTIGIFRLERFNRVKVYPSNSLKRELTS